MSDQEYGIKRVGNYYNHHHVTYGGQRIGVVKGYAKYGGSTRWSGSFDAKDAKGLHSPVAKHEFPNKKSAMDWVVSQHKQVHEEVAANAIGNAGEGAIKTFDPLLGKKKKEDGMARRKGIKESKHDMDSPWDDEDEETPDTDKSEEDNDTTSGNWLRPPPIKKKMKSEIYKESDMLDDSELECIMEALGVLVEGKAPDRYGKPTAALGAVIQVAAGKAKGQAAKRTYSVQKRGAPKVSTAPAKSEPIRNKVRVDKEAPAPAKSSPSLNIKDPEAKSAPAVQAAPKPKPQPSSFEDHLEVYRQNGGNKEHHDRLLANVLAASEKERDFDERANKMKTGGKHTSGEQAYVDRKWVSDRHKDRSKQIARAKAIHNPPKPGVWNKIKTKLGLGEDVSYEDFISLVCESLADYELDKYLSEQLAMKVKQKYIK